MISLLFLLGLAHVWCASLAGGSAARRVLSSSRQAAAASGHALAPRSAALRDPAHSSGGSPCSLTPLASGQAALPC